MVSQVLHEEGLDDGVEHGACQEGDVAEDVHLERERLGRYEHDEKGDENEGSPGDDVGE